MDTAAATYSDTAGMGAYNEVQPSTGLQEIRGDGFDALEVPSPKPTMLEEPSLLETKHSNRTLMPLQRQTRSTSARPPSALHPTNLSRTSTKPLLPVALHVNNKTPSGVPASPNLPRQHCALPLPRGIPLLGQIRHLKVRKVRRATNRSSPCHLSPFPYRPPDAIDGRRRSLRRTKFSTYHARV